MSSIFLVIASFAFQIHHSTCTNARTGPELIRFDSSRSILALLWPIMACWLSIPTLIIDQGLLGLSVSLLRGHSRELVGTGFTGGLNGHNNWHSAQQKVLTAVIAVIKSNVFVSSGVINAVSFLQNAHENHPIAHPWGPHIWYLWFQNMISNLLCHTMCKYHVIIYHICHIWIYDKMIYFSI